VRLAGSAGAEAEEAEEIDKEIEAEKSDVRS
jgi:hypothetical protein